MTLGSHCCKDQGTKLDKVNRYEVFVTVPLSGTTFKIDLVNFSLFILSNHFRLQTVRRFSMRTHLSHDLHCFTNTQLSYGNPCSIKLNFILDSSFLCSAWLCCHTHVHHTCSMLLFHSATTMWLHHVIHFRTPALDSIGRFNTNMYILYASI